MPKIIPRGRLWETGRMEIDRSTGHCLVQSTRQVVAWRERLAALKKGQSIGAGQLLTSNNVQGCQQATDPALIGGVFLVGVGVCVRCGFEKDT